MVYAYQKASSSVLADMLKRSGRGTGDPVPGSVAVIVPGAAAGGASAARAGASIQRPPAQAVRRDGAHTARYAAAAALECTSTPFSRSAESSSSASLSIPPASAVPPKT